MFFPSCPLLPNFSSLVWSSCANFEQVSIGFLCFSRQENVELRGELHKLRAQMPQVDLGGKNQLGRVENSFCLAKR